MNKARKFLMKASEKFDLPADVLAAVPRIELMGQSECSIEPHCGLIEYGRNRIIVGTHVGDVILEGKDLQIKQMNGKRISVSGMIDRLVFLEDRFE